MGNLRKNLEDKRGAKLEELPKVLWAQHTTKKIAIDESPFTLVYETEEILTREASLLPLATLIVEDAEENQRQLARNLDLLVEV